MEKNSIVGLTNFCHLALGVPVIMPRRLVLVVVRVRCDVHMMCACSFVQQAPLCNFNFAAWKRRYGDWSRNKTFSSVELFRRHNDVLTRKQFIDGLMATST